MCCVGRSDFPFVVFYKKLKIFSETTHLFSTKFDMNPPLVNLYPIPARNFDLLKSMCCVGRSDFPFVVFYKKLKIFSETTHLFSTKFDMNPPLVNLYPIPARNFDLLGNMAFLDRLTLVILPSGVTQALMVL